MRQQNAFQNEIKNRSGITREQMLNPTSPAENKGLLNGVRDREGGRGNTAEDNQESPKAVFAVPLHLPWT